MAFFVTGHGPMGGRGAPRQATKAPYAGVDSEFTNETCP